MQGYSELEGKSKDDLYLELRKVFLEDEELQEDGFVKMVELFAKDDFYKHHRVARTYLGYQLTQKEQAIEKFNKSRVLYKQALSNLSDAYSGYKELVNTGKFDEAYDYLDDMPDCVDKTLMLRNVTDREQGRIDYKKHPLK